MEKNIILLDEKIIGTTPFVMKELILRGYRVMAISPLCEKIEVECFNHEKILSNTQVSKKRREIISERR